MSGRALAAIVVIALAVAAAASLGGGEPPRVAADHTATVTPPTDEWAEGRRYMTMLRPLPAAAAEVASGDEVLLQVAS